MREPRYSVVFHDHLGLYAWRVEQGAWLLSDSPEAAHPRELRVVALGGGNGLPVVLRGLKSVLFPSGPAWAHTHDSQRLTGIVTVADDGGSSGRLRKEHNVLPPGDIRNCLLALSDGDPLITRLFSFRFDGKGETSGHSLGNLILTALSHMGKGFADAVEQSAKLLTIRGQVFPSTPASITLRAEFTDGSSVDGESRIAQAHRRIRRIRLEPPVVPTLPQVLTALEAADLIVIGPGSLYTSLVPVLLVKEIADAIGRSRARVVLVGNLMTEPGETNGFTATDHLEALAFHAPNVRVHDLLLNSDPIPTHLLDRYAAAGAVPVPSDPAAIRAKGCRPVERPLLARGNHVRHDPAKLARALVSLLTAPDDPPRR